MQCITFEGFICYAIINKILKVKLIWSREHMIMTSTPPHK